MTAADVDPRVSAARRALTRMHAAWPRHQLPDHEALLWADWLRRQPEPSRLVDRLIETHQAWPTIADAATCARILAAERVPPLVAGQALPTDEEAEIGRRNVAHARRILNGDARP